MKKIVTPMVALVALSACDSGSDVAEFEKKQANAAKEIVAQQAAQKSTQQPVEESAEAEVVVEEAKADTPCLWAGLKEGCEVVAFEGSTKLYAVKGEAGDILTLGEGNKRELSHSNFTMYASKLAELAKTQGVEISEADIKKSEHSHTQTQRGYILTVNTPKGAGYILQDGRVMGKFTK